MPVEGRKLIRLRSRHRSQNIRRKDLEMKGEQKSTRQTIRNNQS
jgi:hypothetical protein